MFMTCICKQQTQGWYNLVHSQRMFCDSYLLIYAKILCQINSGNFYTWV